MARLILPLLFSLACSPSFGATQEPDPRICFTANQTLATEIDVFLDDQPKCVGRCDGCGCNGGPGYRNFTTGECVGWQQLNRACGPPPHNDCFAECERPVETCTLPDALRARLLSDATPSREPGDLEDKPARQAR